MKAYIKSSSAISPNRIKASDENSPPCLKAIEPDYKNIINPKLSRRMGRIIKMSLATAIDALDKASVKMPAAISVGTGLGCTADTEKFLKELLENEEGTLSPTAFIQSTHNTIAGQIALMINCPNPNFTFSNRGHSFENALTDAILHLEEGNGPVLLGGADEITPFVNQVLWELDWGNTGLNAVLPGEGASFFLLSKEKTAEDVALTDFSSLNNVMPGQVKEHMLEFLKRNQLGCDEIDVLLTGDRKNSADEFYTIIKKEFSENTVVAGFKDICGEYFTATAYAMHFATSILKDQKLALESVQSGFIDKEIRKVLIYNNFAGNNHSFILLSK